MKCYDELIELSTFRERYEYLRFRSPLFFGQPTKFRYLNQRFYHSLEWADVCRKIMLRDNGNDLAIDGRPIFSRPIIHHINPITLADLEGKTSALFDPQNLISTSLPTHNAIHFCNDRLCFFEENIRRPNDTCPWKEA